jgi:hypothetical protein
MKTMNLTRDYSSGITYVSAGFVLLAGSKYWAWSVFGLSVEFVSGVLIGIAIVAFVAAIYQSVESRRNRPTDQSTRTR